MASCYPSELITQGVLSQLGTPQQPKGKGMFRQMVDDVRSFMNEHRFVIYTVAIIFLIDHFFLKGVFRDRLQGIIERMVGKVEQKIHEAVDK